MTITLYGIPNCDTVKKARKWLDAEDIAYTFHDYKKDGADGDKLKEWTDAKGWEIFVNRRGTTFKKLPSEQKDNLNQPMAIALMQEHTSMIKRPVVEYDGGLLVGFNKDEWAAALK
ncbi:ArsC family reductase [Altericroceibacterium spongiae]|uniref:ArsC family reductase n=1 Tax=Altericroceibacterium spongiae TaxID=2320269 RepID=A0A420EM00_9SPHN|nr:ArsC family reductase [Altericroceibacterium spongiae]RKF21624.1 ArsC family reductase [Altericroceibacterium spongiae]